MKKFLICILALSAIAFSGCGHRHAYDMDYYVYDSAYHWHQPTCEHQEEVKDKGEHTLNDEGVCKVCGYNSIPFELEIDYTNSYYRIVGLKDNIFGEVTLPQTYKGLPVKGVEMGALKTDGYEKQMTSLIIPDSYEYLDYDICSGMHSLKSVVIGNGIKEIPSNAFEDCINLESVTFGNSLEAIYAEAFQNCAKLTNVVLPSSLKEITYRAFAYCDSITSIVIPKGVTKILNSFYENEKLTDVYCEIESKPEGWDDDWLGNFGESYKNNDVKVHWGQSK